MAAYHADMTEGWTKQDVEDHLHEGLIGKEHRLCHGVNISLTLLEQQGRLHLEVKRSGSSDVKVRVGQCWLTMEKERLYGQYRENWLIQPDSKILLPLFSSRFLIAGCDITAGVKFVAFLETASDNSAEANLVQLKHGSQLISEEDLGSEAHQPNGHGELVRDLEKVLDQPTFTDWTLVCQGRNVPCHRFMLAARSPIFKQLFASTQSQDWSEISNLDLDTLYNLMEYIYTDSVNTGSDIAKLFAAADEYCIFGLKSKCSVILKKRLSVDNVIQTLQLAILHNDDDLKTSCFKLLAQRFEDIRSTESWSDLKSESNFKATMEDLMAYISKFMLK